MKFNRRQTIILGGAAAAAVTLSGTAQAAEGDMIDIAKLMAPAGGIADHVMGSATAPVTVIEYASPTCPHCAQFNNEVFPAFKTAYIDTGKVKFIMRPFLRNALDAVVFLLAETAGGDNYHGIVDAYFKQQPTWMVDSPKQPMLDIAMQFGYTLESFEAVLTNQELVAGMNAMAEQADVDFGLEGTPTFYVNGKTLSGEKTLEQLAAEIDPLVPADFVATTPTAAPATAPVVDPATTPAVDPAATPAAEPATPAADPAGAMAPVEPAAPAP